MTDAPDARIVFLVGPPGSGKTALGRRACAALGLRFADLADDGHTEATLQELIAGRGADVVALPWAPGRDARWLDLCRQSGETIGLWAHPLDMQARSGRAEPLFTPVKRLKTGGGFGRKGIACREFRHMRRLCHYVLMIDGRGEDAVAALAEALTEVRNPPEGSPAEQEDLVGWIDDWRRDFGADPAACEVVVDAMARFLGHLRARGASHRTLASVCSDLNSAGFIVMRNCAPKGRGALREFKTAPSAFEFRRLITESPAVLARFQRTCEAFASHLREAGMLEPEPARAAARQPRQRGRRSGVAAGARGPRVCASGGTGA